MSENVPPLPICLVGKIYQQKEKKLMDIAIAH
jgi:hypothetical protein